MTRVSRAKHQLRRVPLSAPLLDLSSWSLEPGEDGVAGGEEGTGYVAYKRADLGRQVQVFES